jgi:hypothetical protein
MTTVRHMECVLDKILMMFGDKNPIIPSLNSFITTISEKPSVGSWREQDWKALDWLVALGMQKVFMESHNGVGRGTHPAW